MVTVPFEEYKLHLPTEVEEWLQGRAKRVSVNSSGIGGVNAYVCRNKHSSSREGISLSRALVSLEPPR